MTTLVIDWDEAMQQCGDDEEFLRELLGDLRTETDTQMSQMEIIIQNPNDGNPFIQICRAAHVIKGAASNLMCGQLRETAMALETAATEPSKNPALLADVQQRQLLLLDVHQKFINLKTAVQQYKDYLQSVGV